MTKSKSGIALGELDYTVVKTDILRGVKEYPFPEDMDELVYLSVEDFSFTIDDKKVVLKKTPDVDVISGIVIHYRAL